MIAYAKGKGLAVRLSSNLYAMKHEDLEKIVDSGLDHIRISLDGASEETYVKYRVGGHFQQVFDNMKTLIEIKKQCRSKFPLIEWQFLVMKHNEHEIPRARRLAMETGVDIFTLGKIGFGEAPYDGTCNKDLMEEWLPRHNSEYRFDYDGKFMYNTACFFLWETVTLNWDGGLAPCCVLDDQRQDFGNALEKPFKRIWNNELYQSSRREFDQRIKGTSGCRTACLDCKIFMKR